MKKKILICLERLDIGGVETSVMNQALEYKRRGYDIIIMAQKGIYTQKLEKKGIKCINYEFVLEDKFFIEKENYIKEIIDKENITEVHVHQYPCILHLLPVLLKNRIPYVAFVHSIIEGTYEWFMKIYKTYNIAFPLYFQNARRIVTIREKEIDYNAELFNIKDKDKYFILKNSINFDELPKNENYPNKIDNYLLISRISEEKLLSIERGIEFFLNIENKNKKLSVVGDGKELAYLKKKYQDEKIKFLGKTNKVFDIMNQYDAIIGVDRCILEAICCKKLAIISSYSGVLEIVDVDNIDYLSQENFSGKNLTNTTDIAEKIVNINKDEYKKIVNSNYNYAYEKFNIEKNILDEQLKDFLIDYDSIYNYSNYVINKLNEQEQEKDKVMDELANIKNSRSWKFASTLINIRKNIIKLKRGE